MYARVIDATGWTWDYVGQYLTLPRLAALVKRWKEIPPVSESVAAYLHASPSGSFAPIMPASNDKEIGNDAVVAEMHHDPRALRWEAIR